MTSIANLHYVFTKFINHFQNLTHVESFSSLISKLCDHPLSFFFTKMASSANFLGWFYDKDVFYPTLIFTRLQYIHLLASNKCSETIESSVPFMIYSFKKGLNLRI